MTDVSPYRDKELPTRFQSWIEELRQTLLPIPPFLKGDGTPEGSIKARQAARYYNRTGAPGTYLYIKTTDGGNTGWVAYA